MQQPGLGQVGPQQEEEKFTVDTAVRKNADTINDARKIGRPRGTAGLGTPPEQPAQNAAYSQQAIEAVLSGAADPQKVLVDTNVSEQAKVAIRRAIST